MVGSCITDAVRLDSQDFTKVNADIQKEMRETENYVGKNRGDGTETDGTEMGEGAGNCEG